MQRLQSEPTIREARAVLRSLSNSAKLRCAGATSVDAPCGR